MYSFDKRITEHQRKLIEEAIKIVKDLNAPITDTCHFTITQGYSRYGYCAKDKKYGYKIAIHPGLIEDDEYTNTAIHELLHTIDNEGYTIHRGNWKKWAYIVSSNTKYKITVTDNKKLDTTKIKKRKSTYNVCKDLTCPMCKHVQTFTFQKELILDLGFIINSCKKCQKPYYLNLPDSILKDKTKYERHEYFKTLDLKNVSFKELQELLPYLDENDTIELLSTFVQNNEFPSEFNSQYKRLLFAYGRASKNILSMLCDLYCNAKLGDTLTNKMSQFEFEFIFARTEFYHIVTECGKTLYSNSK